MSLSRDDPPILTALAAGHVTITAGMGSADVTVWDPTLLPGGTLPLGTVIWSNPGDGSGVQSIVPAVPSTSGVADVFAFQADGTVQAITSDGNTAWTADVSNAFRAPEGALPDFQGGLVLAGQSSIWKLDGITGQPYPAYTVDPFPAVTGLAGVHTDGTIFAIQSTPNGGGTYTTSVIGIDPLAGTQKFSVQLPAGDTGAGNEEVLDFMIAGDGYAYVACQFRESTGVGGPAGALNHLSVVQVSSAGASANIDVFDWTSPYTDNIGLSVGMITNADQGILLTWDADTGAGSDNLGMAITTGTNVSMLSAPQVPGGGFVVPVLQAQDGSFVGTFEDPDTYNDDMVAFDAAGNIRWIVPNETPQIATADGGVIGQSGITYDQNGNATGQMAMPIQSWTGNAYQVGSVDQVTSAMVDVALSLNPFINGNPSGNGTAAKYVNSPMFLPGTITDPSLPFSLANISTNYTQQLATLFGYYTMLSNAISPMHAALYPLLLRQATAWRFLAALGTTNTIVGYIDHGLEAPNQTNARGLCFWNWCIQPQALAQWPCDAGTCQFDPAAGNYMTLPNGFTPRAKVVFLAACGIDAQFLAQWHLAAQGQALIVPQYNNPGMLVTLFSAADEWNVMLTALGSGRTVAQAVAAGVAEATKNNSTYTWIIAPGGDGSVDFNAKPAQ